MSLKFSNEIESRVRKIIGNRKLDQERILIEKAGEKFRESCKELPEFVCTVCHHMMFKNGFHEFHADSYKKLKGLCLNVLEEKYQFRDNSKVDDCGNVKEFICQNCDRDLKKGVLPAQAVANNLEVPDVPDVLKGLTRLEVRCIALRIPFMNIRALRKGGLGKISGACVNVPASLEPIAEVLPCVPQDTELILLKFKRMLSSKSNYLYDYIRPKRVMDALKWLKANNSLYKDIIIDEDWFRKFEGDDLYEDVCEEKNPLRESIDEGMLGDGNDGNEEGCNEAEDSVTDDSHDSGSDDDEANMMEAQAEENRRAEIRIGGSVTCMQIEDLDEAVFCIALGEGSIPKYILMDEKFE